MYQHVSYLADSRYNVLMKLIQKCMKKYIDTALLLNNIIPVKEVDRLGDTISPNIIPGLQRRCM